VNILDAQTKFHMCEAIAYMVGVSPLDVSVKKNHETGVLMIAKRPKSNISELQERELYKFYGLLLNAIDSGKLKPCCTHLEEYTVSWVLTNYNLTFFEHSDITTLLKNHEPHEIHDEYFNLRVGTHDNVDKPYFGMEGLPLSPKMKAAIEVLQALHGIDKGFLKGQAVKKRIERWLTKNYMKFGLNNKDKTISKKAVEEVTNVVNWNVAGGAPKTGLKRENI